MQKKKLMILLFYLFFIKTTVYAEDINFNDISFVEYINEEKVDEYGNEYITEVEDVLIGEFVLTAYCPCSKCCGKNTGITASGTTAKANYTIAADTSVLPFGTEVIINGEKYVVEDTGGAIKSNRIDVFFNTHSEALAFGKKTEKVYKQEEVTIVLKPVEFREYMLITGDLMKRKIAEHEWDKATGNVVWKNRRGEILATRTKTDLGFENRVEEETYKDWKRNKE